jgi:hypothetical protein
VVLCALVAGCVDLAPPARLKDGGPPVTTDGPPVTAEVGSHDVADNADVPDAPIDAPIDVPSGGPDDGAGGAGDDLLEPPDLPPEVPLVVTGNPCDMDWQCASGVCAQGICCATTCTDACRACNLAGTVGTCSAVPAGDDPQGSCAPTDVATCGLDGTCDGAGHCRLYAAGSECVPGSCANAVESSAYTCDGAGTCRSGSSRSCAPGICMGSSCASTCTQPSDCQPGFFCDNSHCTVARAQGAACTADLQCMSGHCVDHFCCNSQCGEMCRACNVAGALGTCTLVPSGGDPRTQCPAEAVTTCGRAGGCDGAGACRRYPTGTTCGPTSCSGTTQINAATCNGLGVCQAGAPHACGAYLCAGTACATTCAADDVCAPGLQCTAPACVPKTNLALYWRFEETSGTVALDSSVNQFNGTYVGPPAPSAVLPPLMYPNGSSRLFTAASRHAVHLTPIPAALKPANNVSISLWYRATSVDQKSGTPVGAELLNLGNNYLVRLRPDGLELAKGVVGGAVQCRTPPVAAALNGSWHHVAGVLGSTEGMKLYFDGVLQDCLVPAAKTNTANIGYDGSDLFVGRQATGEDQWDFGGNIDEVRIYTRALSAADVTALAQGRN